MNTEMLTSWTTTTWGKTVVGVSILGLGLGHFGRGSDWMGKSVMGVSVGTVAGAVGVLVGATMLLKGSVLKMMDKIKGMLLSRWTVGGSLAIIGGVTLVGGNWMGDVLNRVFFALPVLGDITLLRIMGLITLLLGVAVLTGFDPLDLQDEV